MRSGTTVLAALVLSLSLHAGEPRRHALLVGINKYDELQSAAGAKSAAWSSRDWSNLDGTLNDVALMRGLIAARGFQSSDITTLENRQATRKAILNGLARLAAKARKGDIVFFYYSGHGSQVHNSLSREDDKLDESIVPADSRQGVDDIRDKELRDAYNRILDRGAKLTVIQDACHSGSGARGLSGEPRVRFVKPDDRDAADASTAPLPQDRGALILAAAQDFDLAFETEDRDGVIRGAFTWAFARAVREARPGEPVSETFLRAQALLFADRPAQNPVMSGTPEAQSRPFLEVSTSRRERRPVLAIESMPSSGSFVIQGGWVNGLTVGSELRVVGSEATRLEVTSLLGVSRAMARVRSPVTRSAELREGALLELAAWAPPPGKPLRVWIPYAEDEVIAEAQRLQDDAERRGLEWITDPTEKTPACLLRWADPGWEIVVSGRATRASIQPLDGLPPGTALFVQLPASRGIRHEIGQAEGVELTTGPRSADYILVGRATAGGIEYAWVRPGVTAENRKTCPMPSRTTWTSSASDLSFALSGLARVHGWLDLESPPGAVSYYRLGIRQAADEALVQDGKLLGDRSYYLVLRAGSAGGAVYTRYLYAFVIDSTGAGILLFPRSNAGPVENRLPATAVAAKPIRNPPAEIPLEMDQPFTIAKPYGTETYILLTTDEPLLSLTGLEWNGTRAPGAPPPTSPLEKLLAAALDGTRGGSDLHTPPNWSIEKVAFQSVDPRGDR